MAKILIAEDERPISELVKRNLMLVGHTAAQAFDGPCALEMAGAERFDLVLLDVMLPGCSGFEVKEQLDPALPVIFVTAKNNLSSRLQGLGLGADDYIVKPFEILELLARVEAVLRRVHAGAEVFDLGDCHVEFGTHRVRCRARGGAYAAGIYAAGRFGAQPESGAFPGKAAAIGLGLRL